jgi:hypothetical protein
LSSPNSFQASLGGSASSGTISQIPLWGRAYKLSVKTSDGNTVVLSQAGWEPEALRFTFDILETTIPSPWWYALVKVFNLNDVSEQNLLYNAVWLTLEAGYQSGPSKSSIIWDGPILQTMFNRENVVDLTITFNCLAGPWFLEEQFITVGQGRMSSQYDAVSRMISQINGDVDAQTSAKAKKLLQAKQYPRGKTIFGNVSKYIAEMSQDNFLNNWIDGAQSYLSELYNPDVQVTPEVVYAPPFPADYVPTGYNENITRSIIGVPRQSQFGVILEVLLDPRMTVKLPPILIKIDQSVIQQLKVQYMQLLTPLDQSGLYIAAQIRHHGDTRGNDWYTEITGYTRGYAQGLLEGEFTAQPGAK